jgi:glutamate racemase
VPIIGMIEPGVKALKNYNFEKVGVIGTNATIESGTFENKLREKFKNIEIYSSACPLFVPLAEEGRTEGEIPELIAKEYLYPLIENNIDTLIFGCTHYPLLHSVIKKIVGNKVKIIEPGKEVALLLEKFLEDNSIKTERKGSLNIYLSDIPRNFRETVVNFLGEDPGEIQLVNLKD